MSMTGSGGEENCLEPSSGVFSEGNSRQVSPVPTGAASKCIVSPLLRIFSSKEVVPKILEYEKAVLVMKEHNYAKAVERPEILKLSSLLTESPLLCEDAVQEAQPLDSITDINTLLSTRKDLLLVRESVSRKEDRVVSNHLHQVVGVQIELLREQQEQLHDRDKELSTVRKDKEQVRKHQFPKFPLGHEGIPLVWRIPLISRPICNVQVGWMLFSWMSKHETINF